MRSLGLYHKSKSNFAYALDEKTVRITLQSYANSLNKVWILYDHEEGWPLDENGARYWKKRKKSLTKEFSTIDKDYWQVDVCPYDKKMRYGFLVEDKDGRQFIYIETGLFNPNDKYIQNDINSYFAFPYIHSCDVFNAPKWVKDTVWYQIFPDRFLDKNQSYDSSKSLGENSLFGGNLRSIIENISYIKKMGFTGIYLTPIFKANTSHRYDTVDYYEIDPLLGTKEDLKDLVDICHLNDIKIILDGVFNHIGSDSLIFQDVIEKEQKSKFVDWFYIKKFPLKDQNNSLLGQNYANFVPTMPKLNTQNPEVQNFIIGVAKYWIEHFDIDGWRLDVANEVDHQFWRRFRQEIKNIKQDAYIVGEIWHDSSPWLKGDQFDGVMNYLQTKPILEYVINEKILFEDFKRLLIEGQLRYGNKVNQGMFNLLDSHDTPRISELSSNPKQVETAIMLMALLPGSMSIYYGTERYLKGGEDPDNRRVMPWDTPVSDIIPKIVRIKSQGSLLGDKEVLVKELEPGLVVAEKSNNSETVTGIFNLSDNLLDLKGKKIHLNNILLTNADHENILKKYEFMIFQGGQ